MRRDVLTDAEKAYCYGFHPAGFLRTWSALYETKCLAGPWTIASNHRRKVYGGLLRGNIRPVWRRIRFDAPLTGWEIVVPLGFGTLHMWGYNPEPKP